MAEMDSLRELYVEGLKDLWSAENQILKGLPRMIKAASHPQLKRAFTKHEAQTRMQVKRLERICKELGESPRGKKCVGMEGLIEEAKELLGDRPWGVGILGFVLGAVILVAALSMHYLVAFFGFLVVPLGVVSIVLVILQPLAVGAWCTLCLVTAVAMLLMISPAAGALISGNFAPNSENVMSAPSESVAFRVSGSPGVAK